METTPGNKQTNLLAYPEDVVYDCIFPLLDYTDILRLRRVGKSIKAFADEYIRNNYNEHVRKINESNYTLSHFLQANIPSSRIHLQNSSSNYFEDPDIPEFLRLHGQKITHVHAQRFYNCVSLPELHFYSSLPNLQHLELDCIDARKSPEVDDDNAGHPFPTNFKNLKTLKLNEIWVSDMDNLEDNWELINFCDELEFLKFHPLFKNISEDKTIHRNNSFDFLIKYIEDREGKFPNCRNLQFFDLEHHGDFCDYRKFATLAKLSYRHNIKLLNVPSELVDRNSAILRRYPGQFTSQLVSLRNVMGFMMLVELPNLESLTIEKSKSATFRRFWPIAREEDEDDDNHLFGADMDVGGEGGGGEMIPFGRPPQWEKLKCLDLTIDSEMIRDVEGEAVNTVGAEKLFRFLFPWGQRRETVKELAIRFDVLRIPFPVPEVTMVTRACPCVTKLTLTNWQGRDEDVSRFWEKLPLLEDVTLEKCKRLGDMAFMGRKNWDDEIYWQLRELDDMRRGSDNRRENEDQPVFLGLKKLRKLSLKNLELMPGITDQTFEKIFRHLKIKEFLLTSERPINTITLAGIESLLCGSFNDSVERFPFKGWSLMGVSEDALAQLNSRFRANYMI